MRSRSRSLIADSHDHAFLGVNGCQIALKRRITFLEQVLQRLPLLTGSTACYSGWKKA
jgi:hypothetical protein